VQFLHAVADHGDHEGLAGREVSVERADANPGAAGDLLQRGVGAAFGERGARLRDQPIEVAPGIRPLRPLAHHRLGRHVDQFRCRHPIR
jgi:hypothetical protein